MKKISCIILLITFQIARSQNPTIIDNQWYIQNITIDEVDYYPPPGGFQGTLIFLPASINLSHPTCTESLYGTITYSGSNAFDLSDGPFILLDLGCSVADSNYMDLHESIYYTSYIFAKNPFTYTVETNGDDLNLTIENGNGDVAYYGNYPVMNVSDFNTTQLSIFPNPSDKLLHIEAQIPISNLVVYELSGKILLERNKIEEKTTSIDVSNLSAGIYLMKLEIGNNHILRKFVKK